MKLRSGSPAKAWASVPDRRPAPATAPHVLRTQSLWVHLGSWLRNRTLETGEWEGRAPTPGRLPSVQVCEGLGVVEHQVVHVVEVVGTLPLRG